MKKYYVLVNGGGKLGGLVCQYLGQFASFDDARKTTTNAAIWILDEEDIANLIGSMTLSLSLNNLTLDTKG